MLEIHYSTKFKKDYKACFRKGLNLALIDHVIEKLAIPERLDASYKPHALAGNYNGWSECHIQSDWLLIYRYAGNVLELSRTGSHAELFGL